MYNVDNKLEKEKLLMKQQVYNPYLPLDTYIPDGEPHVFGDRLYIYGSHDAENGTEFCVLDYECFSAPVDIYLTGVVRVSFIAPIRIREEMRKISICMRRML